MGYYHLKNLDINKKQGTITGEFADSNTSPTIYWKSEIEGKTFHEKYSNLIYNIISGNYHPSSSCKYSVLCNAWADPPLKNFIGDSTIIGIEQTYDKYRNVIDDLINNREPPIIKSEIELHYIIDYGKNKDYKNLSQKVRDISNFMKELRNNKELSHMDRFSMLIKFEEELGIKPPLVTITSLEHSTKIYLNFNITNDDFISYNIKIENIETGVLKSYKSENMNITWITDYGESNMAYKIQSYERKFLVYQKCKDFLNSKIYTKFPKKVRTNINSLGIEDNEVRTFLDILNEDERSKNYDYNSKTKEIKFNYNIKKDITELDITDEMY